MDITFDCTYSILNGHCRLDAFCEIMIGRAIKMKFNYEFIDKSTCNATLKMLTKPWNGFSRWQIAIRDINCGL